MWESGGVTPLVRFGTRWRGVVSLAPTLNPHGKSPRYTLNTKLGYSQSRYEHFGGSEKVFVFA